MTAGGVDITTTAYAQEYTTFRANPDTFINVKAKYDTALQNITEIDKLKADMLSKGIEAATVDEYTTFLNNPTDNYLELKNKYTNYIDLFNGLQDKYRKLTVDKPILNATQKQEFSKFQKKPLQAEFDKLFTSYNELIRTNGIVITDSTVAKVIKRDAVNPKRKNIDFDNLDDN